LPKALALPSPAQLRAVNEELRDQVRLRDEAVAALQRETAERQKIEEQMRQSQKLEAVGRLTAGIAHDFNNLLTVIIGNLEKAKRLAGSDANINRCVDHAMLGADRATTLVRQMLAFGRRQPLASAAVDVNRMISQTAEALQRTLGENIRVITNLPSVLPEARCDPHELSAALLNVSLNARDAMPEGGNLVFTSRVILPLERQQRGLPDGSYVELSISDTGRGMLPDVAAKAFEPFFTTKPPGDGSGLGLSQVYGFACQSGGIATLDTVLGHGTTVRIILPQANAGGANATTAGRAPAPSALPQEA
jgi:signal transduction histidine kinase